MEKSPSSRPFEKFRQTLLTWFVGSGCFFGAFLFSAELFTHIIPVREIGGDAMGMGGAFLLLPYLGFALLVYLGISILSFARSWTPMKIFTFIYTGAGVGLGFAIYLYFAFESV